MTDIPIEQMTVSEMLRRQAERQPDAPLILHRDEELSYGTCVTRSMQLAEGLARWGVRAGSHVALMLDNSPEYVLTLLALNRLGAISIPINTAARGELLRYFIVDADTTHMLVQDVHRAVVDDALADAPPLPVCVVPTRGVAGAASAGPVWGDLLSDGQVRASAALNHLPLGWEPWLILYTSGTTGPSKGNVCPNAHSMSIARLQARRMDLDPADRMYTFLPLFHGNALNYSTLTAIWGGAAIALEKRFSASNFWSDVHAYKATQFNAMMIVTSVLEKLEPTELERDNPLRLAMMVPPPRNRRELEDRWGLKIFAQYALSEAVPIALLDPGDAYDKPRTSGKVANDAIDVRIVDEHDIELPAGTPGEVVLRPRQPWSIFSGYYGKPEATASAFRNLWFHTGDRAYIDAEGYLYFVDRVKDAIRRRGENISAFEIETILQKHPGISEIAAVPAPSEMGEDEVAIFVVRKDETLSEAEIVSYAIDHMAYFMVPRFVLFVDSMPKTPSQKVQKNGLRERAQTAAKTMWDREAAGIRVTRFSAQQRASPDPVGG
ncbi:AMP-binding protein [Szabonella alba]|uniref:AMP-binding protein n=1 Tax=Szabonella alba TaxID=2804194 RepID=A0A8K0VG96_9RHOB|nr:AMP-binding protein [Szabonella alba]MBL4919235.1 AMP-binding protein [Szabonella alba]